MNQLSVRPQFIATLNFVLATDPPPSLQNTAAIVECLCQMMRMEDLRAIPTASVPFTTEPFIEKGDS